ncbi:MAG: glutathione S-transferase family protein [Pseudomonadota bacterium]
MTLFAAPGTISVATALTLEEAGIAYDLRKISIADGEQLSADYLAINPKGRVPALVLDQGILTETGAILEHIATLAPDANLIPADPFQVAKMREMLFYVAATMHVNHAHKKRGHRWADHADSYADMTAKVPETMTASCQYIENTMVGPFVLGDQISLADMHLYTVTLWLKGDGVTVSNFPKLSAFMAQMQSRASVAALVEKGLI